MSTQFFIRSLLLEGGDSYHFLDIVLFPVLPYLNKAKRHESLELPVCGHTVPHLIVLARFLLSQPSETLAVKLHNVFLSSICAAEIFSLQKSLGRQTASLHVVAFVST